MTDFQYFYIIIILNLTSFSIINFVQIFVFLESENNNYM